MKKLLWGEEEYLFWQPEQKSWVFSMKGTAERDSTMAAFRSNTSCLDISRFCLDPSQTCLQISILIKLCFSAHLWFYLQGLCCKASSVNALHWLPVCIKGRSAVLHLCYSCWTTNLNIWQYRESIVCMKTPDLPGLMTKAICRGSTHYYRRAYESSRTEAIKQVWNNPSLTLHKDRCWWWKVEVKFNKLLNKPTFSFTLWLCVFLWLAGLLIDCILALYVHLLWKVTEL